LNLAFDIEWIARDDSSAVFRTPGISGVRGWISDFFDYVASEYMRKLWVLCRWAKDTATQKSLNRQVVSALKWMWYRSSHISIANESCRLLFALFR
jgi:hypothetical protein